MIESNIFSYIDLGDSVQKIDIYSNSFLFFVFNLFYCLLKEKPKKIIIFFIFKCIYYIQILMITAINIPEEESEKDTIKKCLKYIEKIVFFHRNIDSKKTYITFIILSYSYCLVIIFLFIILIFFNKNKDSKISIILNYLILFFQNYVFFPLINIFLLIIKCSKNEEKKYIHDYLNIECYDDKMFFIIFVMNILFLLFILLFGFSLCIFYVQINSINNEKGATQINSNFELLEYILNIIIYIMGYYFQYYTDSKNENYRLFNRCIILIYCAILYFYGNQNIFYYEFLLNLNFIMGYFFISWFSLSLFLVKIFNITNSFFFVVIGWVIFFITDYLYLTYYYDSVLVNAIFSFKNIKGLEMFIDNYLTIENDNSYKSRAIFSGLNESIKESFKNNNIEVFVKYELFINNEVLKEKFKDNYLLFNTYSIIYTIYYFYLQNSKLKNDVTLLKSYFLMKYLNNLTYPIYLLSKMKNLSKKFLYLKFTLAENIKNIMYQKLQKNKDYDNIKYVEISSVLVYDKLSENFKLKISDAISNQIDYLDIIRNQNVNNSTKNLISLGNKIIRLRKDIIQLWKNLIKLNPFSDEIYNDFLLYIDMIIQDERLKEQESNKYLTLKNSKLIEKNNLYHSLFQKDYCGVVLVDGYILLGKVLYTSNNFSSLFGFSQKDLYNIKINDLMPSNIASFHNELIEDAVKYSNMSNIYSKIKSFIFKGKNNSLCKINAYVKALPNLNLGLIFIVSIFKLKDKQLLIVLDENLKINSLSEANSIKEEYTINKLNNFGLNNNLVDRNVCLIIPEILNNLEYKSQKFEILKNDIELKGILYPINENLNYYENYVKLILEKIKIDGKLKGLNKKKEIKTIYQKTENNKNEEINNCKEYYEYINLVNKDFEKQRKHIFYRLVNKSYLNGKYHYCQLYITENFYENKEIFYELSNEESKSIKKMILNEKNNNKAIKIKYFEDENIEEEKKNLIDEKENNNSKIKKDNNNNNNIKKKEEQNLTSSSTTKSSIRSDSESFYKLKNNIINKNQPNIIIFLKFLIIFYNLLTLILIIFNNKVAKSKFNEIHKYLEQNILFNRTKLTCSIIYMSAANLKFLKYNFIFENDCVVYNCTVLFTNYLSQYIMLLKSNLININYYNKDFKKLIDSLYTIEIYTYNMKTTETLEINMQNTLNFILENGLKVYYNYNKYLKDNLTTEIDLFMENLLKINYEYLMNENYGLNVDLKKNQINSNFSYTKLYLITNFITFGIVTGLILFDIYFIYLNEVKFLNYLINFNNENFEKYLKSLDEMKKKLKNENNESNKEENNEKNNEFFSNSSMNKNNKKINSKIENISQKHLINYKIRKKLNEQLHKLKIKKKIKLNHMKQYFLFDNLLLLLKIMLLLILSISYYIIFIIFYPKQLNKFLNFDDIADKIKSIFIDSSTIILKIKKEIINYTNFEIEKRAIINEFLNNKVTEYSFNDNIYTTENYTLINNLHYFIKIPTRKEIEIPSFDNHLIKFVGNKSQRKKKCYENLYNLYYGNFCEQISREGEKLFLICKSYWSSILLKGFEQGIIQLGISLGTFLDDLQDLNNGIIDFSSLYRNGTNLWLIETFFIFLFLVGSIRSDNIFEEIRYDIVSGINSKFNLILIFFIIGNICFAVITFLCIYFLKNSFISFFNFIGIIPVQYLSEDKEFYRDVLKLNEDF